MDRPRTLFSSRHSLPLCLSSSLVPASDCFPSFVFVLLSEASLSHSEQQDTLQEMALDSSLNYICKVSPTHPCARSQSRPTQHLTQGVPLGTITGTLLAARMDATEAGSLHACACP